MIQSTITTDQSIGLKRTKTNPDIQNALINPDQITSSQVEPNNIKTYIKRRKFLGISLLGFAGLTTLQSISSFAAEAGNKALHSLKNIVGSIETTYWERTERFEEKMKLLQNAWERKDFRMVNALTNSLRISSLQAKEEEESLGTPLSGSATYGEVANLPVSWRNWAKGWKYYKVLHIEEPVGVKREKEPVEVLLEFPADQVHSLNREIRVAKLEDGSLKEVISQVFNEIRRGQVWLCKLLFLVESNSGEQQTFIVFYGNNDAELPNYSSDLVTTGDGFGLDIENDYFKAILSKQNGQLEKMMLKKNGGLDLAIRGNGHGEPPAIDWGHDYQSTGPTERSSFQKFRIALWDEVPDYEVVHGPICTFVRRWGFPYSTVHPLFSPSRLNIDVEYRFYSGLPYFLKVGQMTAAKEFDVVAVRDDEWLFTRTPFDEMLWMGPDGKLKIGKVDPGYENNLWGIGFFNKTNQNSFFALFLEHYAEGIPEISHSGSPSLTYGGGINLWSRYPLRHTKIKAGSVLHQKNAYSIIPFNEDEGHETLQKLRQGLLNPLKVSAGTIRKGIIAKDSSTKLARPGEAGDCRISKALLWKALENCKDGQLYTSDINIIEMGLVYDITVGRDEVKVLMTMPHRGRPLAGYFSTSNGEMKGSLTIPDALKQVPGVGKVIVEQTWYPQWSSNRLTDEGRQKLGL